MLDERDEWSNMKRTKLQFIQFTQFYKTLLENLEGIKNSWKWNGPVQVKGQLGKLILNCWGFFCVQKFWNNAKMKFCHMVQRWSDRILRKAGWQRKGICKEKHSGELIDHSVAVHFFLLALQNLKRVKRNSGAADYDLVLGA